MSTDIIIDNALLLYVAIALVDCKIDRIHSRVQQLCKCVAKKESGYIRKELNSHMIGLVHQHGRCFIVLEHQNGCHDDMCIRSITRTWYRVVQIFLITATIRKKIVPVK